MYSSDEKVLIGFVKNKIEDLGTRRGAYMLLIIFELLRVMYVKKYSASFRCRFFTYLLDER